MTVSLSTSATNTVEASQKIGKAYLVGAGPGDPGLITVRGRELLATADLVLDNISTVPEPGTAALTALAISGLVLARRRRRAA